MQNSTEDAIDIFQIRKKNSQCGSLFQLSANIRDIFEGAASKSNLKHSPRSRCLRYPRRRNKICTRPYRVRKGTHIKFHKNIALHL